MLAKFVSQPIFVNKRKSLPTDERMTTTEAIIRPDQFVTETALIASVTSTTTRTLTRTTTRTSLTSKSTVPRLVEIAFRQIMSGAR